MPAALKEWAVTCRAVLEGEQIVLLRKGGIREEGRRFSVPHDRFWLFATYEHQGETDGLVKEAYRHALQWETALQPPEGTVRLPGWAEVVAIRRTDDPDVLADLSSSHILSDDYAEKRLRWKKHDPLWVLAVRAHRVDGPMETPALEEYRGCSSWVDLDGAVPEPEGGTAALSDAAFASRLQGVLSKL